MLKPICKLIISAQQFPHDRAFFHTAVSTDGRRFVACSKVGTCRLFDMDLRQLDEIDLGTGVRWVQLDETGGQLFVGFHGHIDGYVTAGNVSRFLRLTAVRTSTECCVCNRDEPVICVASWDKKPIISAWDITSTTLIAEEPLPIRGGAGYSLVPHPEGEAMAAVAFSGQSEEWMFWTHYAHGRLRVFDQPEIEGVSFPCFHPTGRELVSHHERLGLCRMRFPTGDLIASVQPEEAFSSTPQDHFSYYFHFSQDDRLLVWQESLALHEFDLTTLRPTRTVLTGAEGMTFGEDHFFSGQSWQLAGGRLLTSDTLYDTKFKNRTHALRLWDASELFGPVTAPDPARPYTKQLLARGAE